MKQETLTIALVGNPNSGKSSLFNHLTGLRQKIGNYPGITVERREGTILYADDTELTLLDLPGTYSFTAHSPDEALVTNILLGKHPTVRKPDAVLFVLSAMALERGLYLVSQVIDQRYPLLIVLTMVDLAEKNGMKINIPLLEERLGVRILPTIADKGIGIDAVREALRTSLNVSPAVRQWKLPPEVEEEVNELTSLLIQYNHIPQERALYEATVLLSSHCSPGTQPPLLDCIVQDHVLQDHKRLELLGIDRHSIFIQSRVEWVRSLCDGVITRARAFSSISERVDRILLHPVTGSIFFFFSLLVLFSAVYILASYPMEWIELGIDSLSLFLSNILPESSFRSLVLNGIIAGVGAVLVFIPQIIILFFFIGLLEESGYMARAVFLLDRSMRKLGLSGKSFVPLVSSFGCAVPGIMAARTLDTQRDRLVTMFIAPLMSCSGRLPVYTLLIAAIVPSYTIAGVLPIQALALTGLYLFGILLALGIAFFLRRPLKNEQGSSLIIELPPYRQPFVRNLFMTVWERSIVFLKRAGTIILFLSILLWYLSTHPQVPNRTSQEQLSQSYLGKAGKMIEPIVQPLGWDWKLGVAMLSAYFQRELFISTMSSLSTIEKGHELIPSVHQQLHKSGKTQGAIMLTALSVLIFFLIAPQCLATIAVFYRETNSWKWTTLFVTGYSIMAYLASLFVFQVGVYIVGGT